MSGYALPKPGPGYVIDPRTGRWVKKSIAAPGKTGSADPSGALGGFTQLQNAYLRTAGQGPDYSGIAPVNYGELRSEAGRTATSLFQPGIDALQSERGYQNARRDVSNKAATNFAAALAGIFTGGKPGAEGEAYSLENFGGSYLAGVAAMMGQQLMGTIANTFNEQDFQLANKLSDLMDRYPEEAENIYADLVKGEQDRVAQGMSIADADYKTQLAALGSAIKFERDNAKDAGGAGRAPTTRTDPATGALLQYDPATGRWVRVTGGKPADPMSASQVSSILSNADQIVTESVNNGANVKDAILQARLYLRDNGVRNFGQWSPYTTPAGPKAAKANKPSIQKMRDGSIWYAYPDGRVVQKKGPGNTGKTKSGLTPTQRTRQQRDWKETAGNTAADAFQGVVDKESGDVSYTSYQDALSLLTNAGIPLGIAQSALNRYWNRSRAGAKVVYTKGPEKGFIYFPDRDIGPDGKPMPGKGRPLVPYQQRR